MTTPTTPTRPIANASAAAATEIACTAVATDTTNTDVVAAGTAKIPHPHPVLQALNWRKGDPWPPASLPAPYVEIPPLPARQSRARQAAHTSSSRPPLSPTKPNKRQRTQAQAPPAKSVMAKKAARAPVPPKPRANLIPTFDETIASLQPYMDVGILPPGFSAADAAMPTPFDDRVRAASQQLFGTERALGRLTAANAKVVARLELEKHQAGLDATLLMVEYRKHMYRRELVLRSAESAEGAARYDALGSAAGVMDSLTMVEASLGSLRKLMAQVAEGLGVGAGSVAALVVVSGAAVPPTDRVEAEGGDARQDATNSQQSRPP